MRAGNLLVVVGLLLTACGGGVMDVHEEEESHGQVSLLLEEDIVWENPTSQALSYAGGPPLQLYLNRHGGTYTASSSSDSRTNKSSILKSKGISSAQVPGYKGSSAQWSQVVGCVKSLFSPYNIVVTDVEPSGEHTEIVVGSDGSPLNDKGWGGRAPMGCDILPNAIGFVYSQGHESQTRWLCESIAHEAGHTFSLDHEYLCKDPMTYLTGCGDKSFQSTAAQCGEKNSRACACNRPSQNSVSILKAKLGEAGGKAPTPSSSSCGKLASGAQLLRGQSIKSCDGRFTLVLQTDGNLVLYKAGGGYLWNTKTNGKGGYKLVMQGDGNLVLYTSSGAALWHSKSYGNPGAWLAVQNDGNLVVYAKGAVWNSGTGGH
jgi:hypothetical protein